MKKVRTFFGNLSKVTLGLILGIGFSIGVGSVVALTNLPTTVSSGDVMSSANWNTMVAALGELETYVDTQVAAAGGGGGIFTKCQLIKSAGVSRPSCPAGFTRIHTYSSAVINSDNTGTGMNAYWGVSDGTWVYNNSIPYRAIYSCSVCEKN